VNWLWLVPLLSFLGLEVAALLDSRDRFQPATYWLRRLLMLRNRAQPLWWATAGLLLWLNYHFLIDS